MYQKQINFMFSSCCIDYVAAAHINADAIIHFGPTCFSKTSANIPYLNVYERYPINVEDLEKALSHKCEHTNEENLVVILDDGYIHCYGMCFVW